MVFHRFSTSETFRNLPGELLVMALSKFVPERRSFRKRHEGQTVALQIR